MKRSEGSTATEGDKVGEAVLITAEQKQALQDGEAPQLHFPKDLPAPVEPGEIIAIATDLTIEILKVIPRKTVWRITYTIRDLRPRLLRQGSPRYNPRSRRHWRPDEELGYTTRPILAMSDAGEAVAPSEQKRQTDEAWAKWEEEHPVEMARRSSRRSAVRQRKGRIRRNPNNVRRRQRVPRDKRASHSTR
jgi:hypothetical protein